MINGRLVGKTGNFVHFYSGRLNRFVRSISKNTLL